VFHNSAQASSLSIELPPKERKAKKIYPPAADKSHSLGVALAKLAADQPTW
jgi:hypothetical protein